MPIQRWDKSTTAPTATGGKIQRWTTAGPNSPGSSVDLTRLREAIGKYESGGRYNALGVVTANGDRAYGKYQVMGNNIPSWTKAALGKSLTKEQFLNDAKAQDAVANYYMGMNLKKYGTVADVASIWFSGRPATQAGSAKDPNGKTVPTYIKNIQKYYNQNSPTTFLPSEPGRAGPNTSLTKQPQSVGGLIKDTVYGYGDRQPDQSHLGGAWHTLKGIGQSISDVINPFDRDARSNFVNTAKNVGHDIKTDPVGALEAIPKGLLDVGTQFYNTSNSFFNPALGPLSPFVKLPNVPRFSEE